MYVYCKSLLSDQSERRIGSFDILMCMVPTQAPLLNEQCNRSGRIEEIGLNSSILWLCWS